MKATTMAELEVNRAKKRTRQNRRREFISRLVAVAASMFPHAPKGQLRFIIQDAFQHGGVIFKRDIPDHEKVERMVKAFLRHQFYFPLHYGFGDVKTEANKKAYEVMLSWGFRRRGAIVECPACLRSGCDFCLGRGMVRRWVAKNYQNWLHGLTQ